MRTLTLSLILIFTSLILNAQWDAGISVGYGVEIQSNNISMVTNEKMNYFENTTLFYTPTPQEKVSEAIRDSSKINLFGNKYINMELTYHKKKFFISNSFLFQYYKPDLNENRYKKEEYYYYSTSIDNYSKTEYLYTNATTLSYSLSCGMNFTLGKFMLSPFAGLRLTRITYDLYMNYISFYTGDTKSYNTSIYKNTILYVQPDAGIKFTTANESKFKLFAKISFMKYINFYPIGKVSGVGVLYGKADIKSNTTIVIDQNGNTETYNYDGSMESSPDMFKIEKGSLNVEVGVSFSLGQRKNNQTTQAE